MSGYEKIAKDEDDAEEDELVESQIEELSRLQEYDYFWSGFATLCCKNVDFMNRKCGVVNQADRKIRDEGRCLCYLLFLPVILALVVAGALKKTCTCFIVRPNGRRKRAMCLLFVGLIFVVVCVIITLIIVISKASQSLLINNYIVQVAFTKYQSITDAVGKLKKNDLQEIFRELQITDSLISLAVNNPTYVSADYITYAKTSKMISSSDVAKTVSKPKENVMTYYLFPQEMSYTKLADYSPAGMDSNLRVFALSSCLKFSLCLCQTFVLQMA